MQKPSAIVFNKHLLNITLFEDDLISYPFAEQPMRAVLLKSMSDFNGHKYFNIGKNQF